MRRRDPEPPPGPPKIEFKPGMANEMLRELAPLLAEEGIDVENIDAPDIETLQRAMNRAVERHNMALFTPVGDTRELTAAALRLVVEALAEDDTALASAILDQVQPESPDNSAPTVSACIGITLGLLDDWLAGSDPTAPSPPRFAPGPTTPARQCQSLPAPPSADRYDSQPSESPCCDDRWNPPGRILTPSVVHRSSLA